MEIYEKIICIILQYKSCLCVKTFLLIGLPVAITILHQNFMKNKNKRHLNLSGWAFFHLQARFPRLMRTFQIIGPMIHPRQNTEIYITIGIAFLTILSKCIVNLYAPFYSKKIVDSLNSPVQKTHNEFDSSPTQNTIFRWDYVAIYVALKTLQGIGSLSLLNCWQAFLWINIQNFVKKRVQVRFFEHIHSLSASWHTNKKTGDIVGAFERGTHSLSSILEHVLFSFLPIITDLCIAVMYLSSMYGFLFGISILLQIILFIAVTILATEWKATFQREMNKADNEQRNHLMQSLLNFETVKCFTNEAFETKNFSQRIVKVHEVEWKVTICTIFMQILQLCVINIGLLGGSLIVVWMICNKETYGLSAGDYILFASYLQQLYGPLNYLGNYYRILRTNLISLECMLQIFDTKPEINNALDSDNLKVDRGRIEFRNVVFGYDQEKCVLKNISFVVPQRKTIAIVGQSGEGKTSILRLLLRLYDVSSGEILIDGQDIRHIKQDSLRRAIGVVPQDTALFNDTLLNNIKYAKYDAENCEVIDATKSACIYEKIKSFPEGYNTQVGERGLKLSGGEKQRIAIARILLKNPPIILLDEATSSLDNHTEREIQASFQKLCKNRTSLIITHRLSTITHVDEILVLQNGRIVEKGRHDDLILNNYIYANMWKNEEMVTY